MEKDAFASARITDEQDVTLASDFRVLIFVGHTSKEGENEAELNIMAPKDVGTVALNNLIAVLELSYDDHLRHVFRHGQFPEQRVLRDADIGHGFFILVILSQVWFLERYAVGKDN